MRTNLLLVRKVVNFIFGAIIVLASPIVICSPNPSAQETSSPADAGANAEAAGGEYSPLSREYHLKAAFLRYVAKFVEWPPSALPAGAINICVLGLVPSFEAFNSINGKDANNRTINVTKITEVNEARGHCQILFVTKTEEENSKKIIDALQNQPILSFGDMDHFAEKGGNMNFYILNNRLAIMINPPAVEKAKLKISDRMLKVVTVVPPVDQTTKN
ncbi:MAG: YfiR family protein [Gammaproteobacteria bacterium]|nr:YfiR family protein [Gammaproteobacteria bacterium]